MSYMHYLKIAGAYFTIYFKTLHHGQGTRYNEIRISFEQGWSNLMLHIVTWCLQGCWTLPVVSVIVVAAQTLKAPPVCPTATDRWYKDKEHTCELLNHFLQLSASHNLVQHSSQVLNNHQDQDRASHPHSFPTLYNKVTSIQGKSTHLLIWRPPKRSLRITTSHLSIYSATYSPYPKTHWHLCEFWLLLTGYLAFPRAAIVVVFVAFWRSMFWPFTSGWCRWGLRCRHRNQGLRLLHR